jgi:hypothetical protein
MNVFFLLPEVYPAPHNNIVVTNQIKPSDVPLENVFAHFDDFSYRNFLLFEKRNLLPKDAKKFVVYFIHMPNDTDVPIDKQVVKEVNNDPNTFLLLVSVFEHVVTPQELHNTLQKKRIKTDKTVCMVSNIHMHNKLHGGIRFLHVDFWESYTRHHQKFMSTSTEMDIRERLNTIDHAKKKFLCLNRNLKPHRIWFYYALLKTGAVKEGHVSYHLPKIEEDKNNYNRIANEHIVLKHIPAALHKDYFYYLKRKMLVRNLDKLDDVNIINYKKSIKNYYQDSVVSIITESDFRGVFLTEKTFKAIVHCHPFFIIGNPHHHELLNNLGYYTFEDLFDSKAVGKFRQAENMLNNLKSKDLTDLKNTIKYDYKDKLEYNFNLFYSRVNSWKNIEDLLLESTR